MPSNLRSNSQSSPAKRSWVSVAAIGSSHAGMVVFAMWSRQFIHTMGLGANAPGEGDPVTSPKRSPDQVWLEAADVQAAAGDAAARHRRGRHRAAKDGRFDVGRRGQWMR